jgi:hypothetical protein
MMVPVGQSKLRNHAKNISQKIKASLSALSDAGKEVRGKLVIKIDTMLSA